MTRKRRREWDQHRPQPSRPNFLFIMVDELRAPMVYDNDELKEWRKQQLRTQELLMKNGISFNNHYAASAACAPSRASLFTGQYPSLHGVTQTTGAAKGPFEPDVFWLDPNTVPTLGDYFRAAGYQTYWKGKWHLSEADILKPGTHNAVASYDPDTGVPDAEKVKIYKEANRLDPFGFDGWIGPEPHGQDPRNSGSSAADGVSGRDVVYAQETVDLIKELENKQSTNSEPWLIVSSFVNPHDITLYGLLTEILPDFDFSIDPSVPRIPKAPSADESLDTKPIAQESYREVYQDAFQPTLDTPEFRRLYYSLQKEVDNEMYKVFQALRNSHFYDNTIIVFTSDHGDLLGAHGGLFQKWHTAYEETIHVPFIIHSPKLFSKEKQTSMLTSHIDVIPTLLGLANISVEDVQNELKKDHTEVHPFVGRDLTPFIKGKSEFKHAKEPIYFMTDDEFSRGLNEENAIGRPYEPVIQPNHLETVMMTLKTGDNHSEEIWKFTRYFDNPQFWSDPFESDELTVEEQNLPISKDQKISIRVIELKTEPVPDQFEMYNLTQDPLEMENLAHPQYATPETKVIQKILNQALVKQAEKKRIYPTNSD